jgi:hypothetical protein
MMKKSEIYCILYLLNKEVHKPGKNVSYANAFNPICWDVAMDEMEAARAFGKNENIDRIGMDRCVKAANALECGQTNLDTLKVYFLGEYIRKNHGCFLKRKKDGSIQERKSKKSDKTKKMYNAVDVKALGNLEGIDFYKPENLKGQFDTLREEAGKTASLINLRPDQTNGLYDLVCAGKIGIHIYLQLWRNNDGFGIDLSKKSVNDEYRKFVKMVMFLDHDGVQLENVWCHDKA